MLCEVRGRQGVDRARRRRLGGLAFARRIAAVADGRPHVAGLVARLRERDVGKLAEAVATMAALEHVADTPELATAREHGEHEPARQAVAQIDRASARAGGRAAPRARARRRSAAGNFVGNCEGWGGYVALLAIGNS